MTTIARGITGGVDTHFDTHVAAALDERGALLGVQSFAATGARYRQPQLWLESLGTVELVGIEGTGSYGAGLTRHLMGEEVSVVEVDRPNRQRRRRTGKSIPKTPWPPPEPPKEETPRDMPRRGTETSRP